MPQTRTGWIEKSVIDRKPMFKPKSVIGISMSNERPPAIGLYGKK